MKSKVTVILSANSLWNIINFRRELIRELVAQGYEVIVAAPGANAAWGSSNGVETADIRIDRSGLNPITDFNLLFDYLKLIRQKRPQFYISFTVKPNIWGSLAAQLTGATSLPNVSGLGTAFIGRGMLARLVAALYRLAFRGCPIVFFQNEDDRDLFIQKRIVGANQARILPGSGVDLDHFQPESLPPVGDGMKFLFVGRLLGDKGVREFVNAARMLRSEYPAWRFQLLGELDSANRSGIGSEELRGWIEEGWVEHLGQASDVRAHIAAATSVVLPSYREGLPRSLLEAAAMGRPLIATDVPGNRRLINGRNGFLCEPKSWTSLADAMRRLGSMDEAAISAMGRESRMLVEREFGVDRVIKAYLEALGQLASPAIV